MGWSDWCCGGTEADVGEMWSLGWWRSKSAKAGQAKFGATPCLHSPSDWHSARYASHTQCHTQSAFDVDFLRYDENDEPCHKQSAQTPAGKMTQHLHSRWRRQTGLRSALSGRGILLSVDPTTPGKVGNRWNIVSNCGAFMPDLQSGSVVVGCLHGLPLEAVTARKRK